MATVPVYIRIANSPRRRIGRIEIDEGVYHPTGVIRLVTLLRETADRLESELHEVEDPDDMSTMPLSRRRDLEG